MAIMPAGVHLAGMAAGMGELVELLQRQGVHIGPQADGTRAVAALDDADHPGLAQTTVHRDAPFGKFCSNHVGGAHFLKTKFGVGVQVAANRNDFSRSANDGVEKVHQRIMALQALILLP